MVIMDFTYEDVACFPFLPLELPFWNWRGQAWGYWTTFSDDAAMKDSPYRSVLFGQF